jgi:ATP-binding cassette subfamily B protein
MEVVKQAREPLHDGAHQPEGAARGDIVFEDVSFMYSDGKSHALKNISFHVKPGTGDCFAWVNGIGQNVAGESAARFHEYTSGRILLMAWS